jgi:hypothetical protein
MPPTVANIAATDQLTAATRHARTVISRLGPVTPITATHSPWLTQQLTNLATAIRAGTARCCAHLGPSPQLVHAAVWAPHRLVCTRCITHLRPDLTDETTCDRCGRPVTVIHPGALALGPILLGYGLCTPCLTTTNLHPRKDHQ